MPPLSGTHPSRSVGKHMCRRTPIAIAELPALTHPSLSEEAHSSSLLLLLNTCGKLRVVVNMSGSHSAFEQAKQAPNSVDNPRFVVMAHVGDDEYLADWKAGANGGHDFWARADRFVAKKKRGEINLGRPSISIFRPQINNIHPSPSFSLTMLDSGRRHSRLRAQSLTCAMLIWSPVSLSPRCTTEYPHR